MARTRLLTAALILAVLAVAACRAGAVSLLDVRDGHRLTLKAAVPDLLSARLVVVGETHDEAGHHRLELAVIKALAEGGTELAVGLEMFPHKAQGLLDDFLSGKLSEEAFVPAFVAHWGHLWPLYRDIFLFCRERGIRLVGLNAPREITRKVAREGFEALTPEERGELPAVSCRVDPEYEAFLRQAMGEHGSEHGFRNFCEAQLVWDTAMAVYADAFLKAHPGTVMVALAGTVHAWKRAMPRQAGEVDPGLAVRVILPEVPGSIDPATVSPGDCDYLASGF